MVVDLVRRRENERQCVDNAPCYRLGLPVWDTFHHCAGSGRALLAELGNELPHIGARSVLPGAADISLFTIQVKSEEIGFEKTIESTTGGIVTVGRLAEAHYTVAVEARDSEGNVILVGGDSADVFVGEVVIFDFALNEAYRWVLHEMSPRRYQDTDDGATQFHFSVALYEAVNAPVGLPLGYEEGFSETLLWIERFADGVGVPRSMSVISYADDDLLTETSRQQYFGVFPIRFEQIDGFATDVKGRYRLILSYDESELAL